MTLRDAYNVFAGLILLVLTVAALVLWNYDTEPATNIKPSPPSGYEYCVSNGYRMLCPKETP